MDARSEPLAAPVGAPLAETDCFETALAPPACNEGLLSPRYRALTIGMVALIALGAFEALAVATAMPTVAEALHGLPLYALAFGGTLAASLVGMVLAGHWSDARGPVPALWNGVLWFVAGLIVAGFASNMPQLLVGRIVQGFGSGSMSVALYVAVARAYPLALRPRIFAAFSAGWVVPSLIGPTLSGLIVQHIGWRWVFLTVPLLAVPATLLLRPGLRELASAPPQPTDSRRDGRRRTAWAVIAAAGACLLHLAGQDRDLHGFALSAMALGALLLAARHLLPAGTLRAQKGLPRMIALRGIVSAAFFGTEVFIPLMLSREYGLSPVWAGAALTVGALGWFSGSWYQGNTTRSWSRVHLLRGGLGLMTVGIALLLAATLPLALSGSAVERPIAIAAVIAGWALTGIGMGLTYPSLSVLTLALSTAAEQGRNSAALQLADALGIASMLAVGGSLFALLLARAPGLAYPASFAITGILAAGGFGLSARTRAD